MRRYFAAVVNNDTLGAMATDGNFDTLILLEDEPVPGFQIDELGVVTFSKVIAGVAKGTAGPFTIGIFGDWGHGKTSVLKQAKSLLDHDGDSAVVTVMFNAWQYEHEEHPLVPLVATIVQAVEKKLDDSKSLFESGEKMAGAALRSIVRSLRAIAYGISAKTKVKVPGFAEVEAGFVAKEMIDRYDKLQAPKDPLLDRTLYYNAFESLDAAAGTHDPKTPLRHKIVVFIDDLDRCLPPQALKLLESIKVVLAQRGFIFVMAVDQRIIQGYLTHRYETEFNVKDYPVGPSYLDKIVQLPLNLPTHQSRFKEYIRRLLDERAAMTAQQNRPVKEAIESLIDVLAIGSNHNPRSLVRFINTLIVDRTIWAAIGQNVDTELLGACAVSRILRQHLGDKIYELLVSSEEVCKSLLSDGPSRVLEKEVEGSEPSVRSQRTKELYRRLEQQDFLRGLLKTKSGQAWLGNAEIRSKVNEFLVQREQPLSSANSAEPAIDAAVRRSLDLPPTEVITDAHRQSVTGIRLGPRLLTDYDIKTLAKMTKLRDLYISSSKFNDVGLAMLKGMPSLRVLHIRRASISPDGLRNLQALPALSSLMLNHLALTDHGLEVIASIRSLKVLAVEETRISDKGISHLRRLDKLRELHLDETSVSDLALAYLLDIPTLTTLSLNKTRVTDQGMKSLAKLASLEKLWLMDTGVGNEGMEYLSNSKSIRALYLDDSSVTNKCLQYISRIVSIESLSLTGTSVGDNDLAYLSGLKNLRKIWLDRTKITDDGLRHINTMTSLEMLQLSEDNISERAFEKLRVALPMVDLRLERI